MVSGLADRAPWYLPQLSQQLWPLCFESWIRVQHVFRNAFLGVMKCFWNIYVYINVFSPLKVRWGAGGGNVLGCCTKNLRLARCNEVYDVCLKVFANYSGSCKGQITAFISPVCR